ncbi:MAG: restriction endonuclease subunit S [Cyclobacteriaceae bacterium]
MSNYESYPAYRESNIDWFPEMPIDWDSIKVKHIFNERVEKGFPNEPLLAATQTKGVVRKEEYENTTVTAQKDFHLLKLVKVGDFVISLRSFQGGIEIAYQQGIISPAYTIMQLKDSIDKSYFKHLFKSKYFIDGLTTFVTGIREGQNIDYSKFRRSFSPLPPKPEQSAIAQFLDRKTAEIKAFIELKEKTIALLKERKTAIINQAVTKGLDPNVEMKDSGIVWLGEIPKHWEVKKLKYLMSISGRVGWKALTASEYVPDGYVFLATPNIKFKEIDFEDVNYITKKRFDESPELILEKGDVLLTKDGSTVGTVNVVRDLPRPSTVNSSIAVLKDKSGHLVSEYCFYTIKSNYLSELIHFKKEGMGVPHLFQSDIKQFEMILPPVSEQNEIVDFIQNASVELDSLMDQAEKEIALIKEYQQSLISEAVTGKIDVRGEVEVT